MSKILILGNGYVGSRCAQEWPDAVLATDRINTLEDALRLLDTHKPDVVLNAAGVRGKPNVDWCETHQWETVLGNTVLPILLAQACAAHGVYLLHIGSGCIFYGQSPDPKGWREDDHANPSAVYSRAKYAADLALSVVPNVGIARIRVPLDDHPTPGNIIDKLAAYNRILDVANSVSVIPDMVQTFRELLEQRGQGIFHVTNPGALSYRTLIGWYRELVDPAKTNEWISEEELVQSGLVSKLRSTNLLQSTRLEAIGIHMRPIEEAARAAMENYAAAVKATRTAV